MARPCKICSNAALRRSAERMLRNGHSDRAVADFLENRVPEEPVSSDAVRRHRLNHFECREAEAGLEAPEHARAEQPRSAPVAGHRAARAEPIKPNWPDGVHSNAEARRLEAQAAKPAPTIADLSALLKKGPLSLEEIAAKLGVGSRAVFDLEHAAKAAGTNIHFRGEKYFLDATPMHGALRDQDLHFTTDNNGTFEFAISTDQHLCSKYERLDCLNDFYDEVEKRGITTVLNAGNWIDGEATFNRHEIHTHGMDNQLQYLAREYPKRAGITTYAVAGADHEGWYSRREGVDIGKYAENVMRQNGREDWIDLGYVERAIPLKHYGSGESSNILIMHPGGGSAYATSYAPQKIVESFDGGEKPAALVLGHYHKADYTYIRNVHTMQGGCFQDQSLFMRSKRLSAHLGGCFVRLTVDPRTGAFIECQYTFRAYYVKEYYNGRWNQHGAVNYAPRITKP